MHKSSADVNDKKLVLQRLLTRKPPQDQMEFNYSTNQITAGWFSIIAVFESSPDLFSPDTDRGFEIFLIQT